MIYRTLDDLPDEVLKTLTTDGQQRWMTVYNAVLTQTGDPEKAYLAAWGAARKGQRMAGRALVFADGDTPVVKGWGMKFTGPWDPDAYGEHFSTMTELLADYYSDAPLWYEHGLDLDYGWRPIGRRRKVEIYGFGVWAEHELHTDHALYPRTRAETERGELSYSSDSIAHYYEEGLNRASGEVRAWPLAGWSLTRHPAEPGLGPVTLDGMVAVIREVVAAPARREPTGDGRTVCTVTACKSVYSPQIDPTVTADNPTGKPEAREARRYAGNRSFEYAMEGTLMDPEMLATLAEFLGVEATPEAVRAALEAIIASLSGASDASQAVPVDGAAVRAALDLEDDADDDAVIERLNAMRALLDEADDDESPLNYAALRRARQQYDHYAATTLADDPPPFMTGGADIDDDDFDPPARRNANRPSGNGFQMPRARRSRSLHAPNVNRGATAPGVGAAVLAALGVRPPGFRSNARMSDIRSRLFQTDRAARAADSGFGPAGAWVLNREIANDILDPLRSNLVLFEAGAEEVPMNNIDSLTVRKMVGVPGAYWAAENTEVTGDDASWAVATLNLKELRAPTTWPNRWLRNLAAGAEQKIRDQIERSMRLQLEYAALFGDGSVPADGRSTGQQPTGVRYTPNIGLRTLSPARLLTLDDLEVAEGSLEDADVAESETWGWLSHSRTFRRFRYMRDQNGEPIMRNDWMSGVVSRTLVDYPYFKTTNVPKTLGGGNESTLFLGDWAELLIGLGMDVELLVSAERYIEKNQTFVMGVAYVDSAVMYPEAFHVTEGVL